MSEKDIDKKVAPKLTKGLFWKFLPFWIFLVFFKFGGGLHYSLISPLGQGLLPLWVIGFLMGGGSIIQLLLDVPAGYVMNRFGYRRFLKITTFVFILAAVCFIFGLTRTTYFLSILISTFGWVFFGPGVNAYILSHAPREKAGKFISFRDIFGSVGIVLASAALPFVIFFTPQHIGIMLLLLLGIAWLALFLAPKDQISVQAEKKLPTHHYYIKRNVLSTTAKAFNKLNPASTMLLLLDLAGSIFYGAIWFTVPLVISHQTVNSEILGIGLGMFDFSIVVLGFLLGNLADKSNKRTLVFFGLLIFSIAGMFLGFNFGILFLLFGFLATSGDEMASISLWSWLHSLDKEHDKDGLVSGVINLFQDLGWAIGPIFAGVAYGTMGPSWTILIGAIPIFITWVIYQFVVRKYHIHSLNLIDAPAKPHRRRHRA